MSPIVPGPPATASLGVLGPDSIEVSFSPPLNDGGSPITSYTVSKNEYLVNVFR